jgi:hypothetical protein
MSDLIYLAVIVGFFAVAFGLVRACEYIIGPDTTAPATDTSTAGASAPSPVEVTA